MGSFDTFAWGSAGCLGFGENLGFDWISSFAYVDLPLFLGLEIAVDRLKTESGLEMPISLQAN